MSEPSIQPAADSPAALFFDVDGTLVWHRPDVPMADVITSAVPSPAVYDAFRRLRENGHQAFICTGRPLCLVSDELMKLQPAGIITGAGACVSRGRKVLSEVTIPRDVLKRVVDALVEVRACVLLEATEECAVLNPRGEDNPFSDMRSVHDFDELQDTFPELRFFKFSYFERERPLVERIRAVTEPHFNAFDLGVGSHESTLIGVDKAAGMRRALELLEGGPYRTFAFGDSENDLAMFDAADVSVAMGNAFDPIKRAATYVTGPVQHDGVVTAMERFGLI